MKYGITRRLLGETIFVEIPKESFEKAKTAKSNLIQILFIEEKLDYVLGNFYEFEREMIEAGLDSIFFWDSSWSKSVSEVHAINRRILNLLAACRLYLDHVVHDLHEVYGADSILAAKFTAKTSEEYDAHLGYRVLEAMRNHVQHRGFPVHNVTRHMGRNDPGAPAKHIVTPFIEVEELASDEKFKSSVLKDLQAIGDKVDIKPLVREYMDCIGRIHETVRGDLQEDAAKWKTVIQNVEEEFRKAGGNNLTGLALVARDDNGNCGEHVDVFDGFIKRREELERKNRHLTHFAGHFVSSEVRDA